MHKHWVLKEEDAYMCMDAACTHPEDGYAGMWMVFSSSFFDLPLVSLSEGGCHATSDVCHCARLPPLPAHKSGGG